METQHLAQILETHLTRNTSKGPHPHKGAGPCTSTPTPCPTRDRAPTGSPFTRVAAAQWKPDGSRLHPLPSSSDTEVTLPLTTRLPRLRLVGSPYPIRDPGPGGSRRAPEERPRLPGRPLRFYDVGIQLVDLCPQITVLCVKRLKVVTEGAHPPGQGVDLSSQPAVLFQQPLP